MFWKRLFTNQFIKDLGWSVVFLLCAYAITHNPIVRPIPQPVPGDWSIQLMQHPLFFGFAGHNYLALKDQNGDIVKELHGLATNTTTGQWKYVGTRATDTLQVWEFDSPRYYLAEKTFPGIILTEGKDADMKNHWTNALACKDPLNEKKIPYPPFGVNMNGDTENSNSVAYTLTLCMGLDARHVGLLTPGETVNLLKK
ncbi:MAG: hypothetical protein WC444_00225 [Candidatus Paceibacterota bacterium]